MYILCYQFVYMFKVQPNLFMYVHEKYIDKESFTYIDRKAGVIIYKQKILPNN